jgi:hypothetical protein
LPNAELKWIAECGHVPHLEQPKETASAIVSFLTSDKVTSVAGKNRGNNGQAMNNDKDNGIPMPTYVIGGGFLGAYLIEEAMKNFI